MGTEELIKKSKNVNFGLSPKQWKFVEALANPGETRTQNQIAIDLNTAPETLSRWKRQNGFMETVYDLAKAHVGAELGRVLGALLRAAMNGDVPAAKLLLEVCGKIKAGGIQNVISGQLTLQQEVIGDSFTNEQLKHIGDNLADREIGKNPA